MLIQKLINDCPIYWVRSTEDDLGLMKSRHLGEGWWIILHLCLITCITDICCPGVLCSFTENPWFHDHETKFSWCSWVALMSNFEWDKCWSSFRWKRYLIRETRQVSKIGTSAKDASFKPDFHNLTDFPLFNYVKECYRCKQNLKI